MVAVEIRKVDRFEAKGLILADHGAMNTYQLINFNECLSMMHTGWAGFVDGELLCVWALCPPSMLDTTAYLWMYHTARVADHQFILIRHSQLVMKEMLHHYPRIIGRTASDNPKARRWLEWLGAKFDYDGDGYHTFQIVRNHG